jgi:hypothetical protein
MFPDRYQSENCDPSPLGRPLKFEFSSKLAKNRFLKAAMTERLSSWDPKDFDARGIPTKNLINVYKRWGEGGFGQILTGNIMTEFDQLEAMGNLMIPPTAGFSGPRFDALRSWQHKQRPMDLCVLVKSIIPDVKSSIECRRTLSLLPMFI